MRTKIENKYIRIKLDSDFIIVVYKYGYKKYGYEIANIKEIEKIKEFLNEYNIKYDINFYQDIENDKITIEYEKDNTSIKHIIIDVLD